MPSLPSTPSRVPCGHGTKSSILYLHSPTVRPKDIIRLSRYPLIQDSLRHHCRFTNLYKRHRHLNKKGTVLVVYTNITENIVKYSYKRVLLKVFGNIRNVCLARPCSSSFSSRACDPVSPKVVRFSSMHEIPRRQGLPVLSSAHPY